MKFPGNKTTFEMTVSDNANAQIPGVLVYSLGERGGCVCFFSPDDTIHFFLCQSNQSFQLFLCIFPSFLYRKFQ